MRASLVAFTCLYLHACAPLPTLGFGVRSTFHASEWPAQRAVDVLAGVQVGWAASRRNIDADASSARARPPNAQPAEPRELACIEAAFCVWERDQRASALARLEMIDGEPLAGVSP